MYNHFVFLPLRVPEMKAPLVQTKLTKLLFSKNRDNLNFGKTEPSPVAKVDEIVMVAGAWHDSIMGVSKDVPALVGKSAVR